MSNCPIFLIVAGQGGLMMGKIFVEIDIGLWDLINKRKE